MMKMFLLLLLAGAMALLLIPAGAQEGAKGPVWHTEVDGVEFNLWVPAGVTELRGVLIKPADKGVTQAGKENVWPSTLRSWGYAELGMMMKDLNRGNRVTILTNALNKALPYFSKESNHPELLTVPFAFLGMSKGGGWSTAMAYNYPQRTIGYVNVCGWMGGDSTKLTGAQRDIPGLYLVGSVPDGFKMLDSIDNDYVPAMKLQTNWTVGLQWGAAHEWAKPTSAFVMLYLDQIIKMRGGTELKPVKWSDGMLADRATWANELPVISSFKDYQGKEADRIWLPNNYIAYIWRAYITKAPVATWADITPASDLVSTPAKREYTVETGTAITTTAAIKEGVEVKKVTFYDGDKKIGEATTAPYTLKWDKVPAGPHGLIAIAETPAGELRCSNVLWVVGAEKKYALGE
ncbi:MAG: Ig-like domain-containing protein [bacterium]